MKAGGGHMKVWPPSGFFLFQQGFRLRGDIASTYNKQSIFTITYYIDLRGLTRYT